MAITVTHSKVSTIPDGDDSSLIRPSDWNDDHVLTGTIPVENGGTGASTLTGYVKGNGTSAMTASATIPNTDVTGLGTMSTQNANNVNITGGSISGATVSGYIPTTEKAQALGVATLDAGGTVPLSQIPASIIGGLNYQGTWNANTNTPTLTSSVGTKGYYYAVSVAGTTNLDGITDWNVGDLAVFDGSAWQQIDNTDAVTSVNGYTGTVVLNAADVSAIAKIASSTDNAITRFDGTTGGLVQNSTVTLTDNGDIANVNSVDFDITPGTLPTAQGTLYWDNADSIQTLSLVMEGGNAVQQIGEETYFRIKCSAAITEGQVVMFTGTVGSSSGLTGAPATGLTASTASYVMGVATESGALNDWIYVTAFGLVRGINTTGGAEAWVDGQILYYDPTVTGGLTKTLPAAPNAKVQVCAVVHADANGSLFIRPAFGGALGQYEGDVQVTTPSNGELLVRDQTSGKWVNASLTAGTAISVSNAAGSVTVTNTAPDQVVSITGAGTTNVTGTYPNFTVTSNDQYTGTVTSVAATAGTGISVSGSPITTSGTLTITNTAPDQTVVLTAGTGISTSGTYPNFTITNTAPSLGGTVTSVSGTGTVSGISLSGTVTSSGSLTLGGSLDLSSPPTIGSVTPNDITGATITASKFVGVSGGTF